MTDPHPQSRLGLYPGSFDPITLGHLDLIDRALALFDTLLIAVADNPAKTALFTAAERQAMIAESLSLLKGVDAVSRVEIITFHGLVAHLAVARGAVSIIRGLRAVSDFEYEFQMALTNRTLAPDVETVFLMPNARYTFLSSAIMKNVAAHGGDVSRFVPPAVHAKLAERFPAYARTPRRT
jgi:pantetheine-phosphate adenylyltransferase